MGKEIVQVLIDLCVFVDGLLEMFGQNSLICI